jgi:negative regulator of sigma-B (phosphoserine phosphatase)
VVIPIPDGVLLGVVDGLGHGPEATAAAQAAVGIVRSYAHESLPALFQRCHEGLVGTRGVVMTVASLNARENTMTWMGVGNVECLLFHGAAHLRPRSVATLLRGGVVGFQLPRLLPRVERIAQDDTLIMATDGISRDFPEKLWLSSSPQRIADRILAEHAKVADDALVLVARYLGGPG